MSAGTMSVNAMSVNAPDINVQDKKVALISSMVRYQEPNHVII